MHHSGSDESIRMGCKNLKSESVFVHRPLLSNWLLQKEVTHFRFCNTTLSLDFRRSSPPIQKIEYDKETCQASNEIEVPKCSNHSELRFLVHGNIIEMKKYYDIFLLQ